MCARSRASQWCGGADAGHGSAPRHRTGSAPLLQVRRRCGCLCASSPGSPSANRAAPPEPAPLLTHTNTHQPAVCTAVCHRCRGKEAWTRSSSPGRSAAVDPFFVAMAQPRKPGHIRLGWRTSCASEVPKLSPGEETRAFYPLGTALIASNDLSLSWTLSWPGTQG